MALSFYFPIFWIIGVIWTIYYWCCENLHNNNSKVLLDVNSGKKGNVMSTNSLNESDSEECTKYNRNRMKYEIKTRWPSRTSMNGM
ncbi:hypothetical protein ANTPLA_LOCUS9384 [Anthophora plagiata]